MDQKLKIMSKLENKKALQKREAILKKISLIVIVMECLIFVFFEILDICYTVVKSEIILSFLMKVGLTS